MKDLIINMTPHPIYVLEKDSSCLKEAFPTMGIIRVNTKVTPCPSINGIPTSITEFGKAEGLPEERQRQFFIVSQLVKSACPDRFDLLVPTDVVRNADGNIIGCRTLGR